MTTVALSAVALPFGLGALLALHLFENHPTGHRFAFALFLGTAMSVTAFPVLARILTDRGLIHTPIGGLALACAAVDDVLAWSLLAVLAALATDWMGLHLIFGAFLFGVVMPREGATVLRERALPWVERVTSVLLLPVFFMVAGFEVDLSGLDGTALGELALILLVAIGGKCLGAFAGARINGVGTRHSVVLAVLVNTRGLTELIVLTVGLQFGVLDQELYSLMVVMALVTTAMAGVLLRLVYPPWRVGQDLAPRGAALESGRDPGGAR